ncbi:hypothetical protein A1O3_01317 [Capronia epimyces CBS 606.96]|uniref:Uncharacterized protein n=1 Tax=Capronia epimyces CBS 606.96 TaxID=1182542 RepID=W9YSV6_9EURO|nr:uncharacterized protein A1O3_01317 [Capronia epimyces CBS 606.96]EXJ92765.1 hypothetical protein A1O3_01317 [Capronia epimyces CBS 606.96]
MPATANYHSMDPSPTHLTDHHGLVMAASSTNDTIDTSPDVSPPFSCASPVATPGASLHGLSSTSAAHANPAPTDLTEKQRPPSKIYAPKEAGRWPRLVADRWWLELGAALVSLGGIFSIFGVLMAYDQKPVPRLVKGITLNAVISFLATISRTSILMSVGTSLSQCKWLWFKKRRNLVDLQNMDNASRGPLGSVLMLFSFRGGVIAYLAAVVMVGALGFEPFVQQLLTIQDRVVPIASGGIHINSTTSMTEDIVTAIEDYPETDAQITAAMLAHVQQKEETELVSAARALIRRRNLQRSTSNATSQAAVSPLEATCPSGNCAWPNYYTLDMCARCQNVTKTTSVKNLSPNAANLAGMVSAARQNKQDGSVVSSSSFEWEIIPRKGYSVRVNSTISAFVDSENPDGDPDEVEYSGDMVRKIVWPLNVMVPVGGFLNTTDWTPQSFAGVEGPVVALGYAEFGLNSQTALPFLNNSLECALTYCVNEYDRSVVEGNLVSNVLSTQYGAIIGHSGTIYDLSWSAKVNGTEFTVEPFMYGAGMDTLARAMVGRTTYSISGNCLEKNNWRCSDTPGFSLEGNYSSVKWEGIDLVDDFSLVVSNANSIVSDVVQQYGNLSVAGHNTTTKSFVVVRWPWITLPLAIVLLGMLTLGITIWETHHLGGPSWKSSLLPLIYCYKHDHDDGDEDDGRRQRSFSSGQATVQAPIPILPVSQSRLVFDSDSGSGSGSGSGPESDLVSRLEVQAERTFARLSKDESAQAQGAWMLKDM